LCCGLLSVEATRRIDYSQGGIVRDLLTVWCLPVAILLPPFYALIVPFPLLALTQLRVHRGIVHRRVFSAGAIALAYAAASVTFRSLPVSTAGPSASNGSHAVLWCLAVAGCDLVAWLINNLLLAAAIKTSDRTARIRDLFSLEAIFGDYVQWTTAVLVTLAAAVSPVLLVFAWPIVLMHRRFLMHGQLVSRARIDAKTGLLNAAAWDREATAKLTHALRAGTPLAVALIDIDYFKTVNDENGHLAGDQVLHAICRRLEQGLRPGDLLGRFGGEEFSLLLLDTPAGDAYRIAERLRELIARSPVAIELPAGTGTANVTVQKAVDVTVSIGVAALDAARSTAPDLTEMLAAADSALYQAKGVPGVLGVDGRNRTHLIMATTENHASGPAPAASRPRRHPRRILGRRTHNTGRGRAGA
jgi:diguanylate cyclase (GGDEF)-like protein